MVTPPLAHDEHDKEQGMHTETSANDGRGGPIVGELSLTTEDGTALTGGTDVALAEQWARHTLAPQWSSLTHGEQIAHVSEALAELRRTYYQTEEARA